MSPRADNRARARRRRVGASAALALAAAGALAAALLGGCASATRVTATPLGSSPTATATFDAAAKPPREHESARARKLALAAMAQVGVTTGYDARYVLLPYPGGDVASSMGACSDVVVRAFRGVGIDLQVKVHKDMAAHFSAYPQLWGLKGPDTNIDQRRVPNLACYFARHGAGRRVTLNDADYWPGDVVTWSVSGKPHVGIVSTVAAPGTSHFEVTHNIGAGAQVQDVLFAWPITGHYLPL